MSDYPEDEQGRKKALAAQESFCKQDVSKAVAVTDIIKMKLDIDDMIKQRDAIPPKAIEFLHNANWHLTQALKIIDGVK